MLGCPWAPASMPRALHARRACPCNMNLQAARESPAATSGNFRVLLGSILPAINLRFTGERARASSCQWEANASGELPVALCLLCTRARPAFAGDFRSASGIPSRPSSVACPRTPGSRCAVTVPCSLIMASRILGFGTYSPHPARGKRPAVPPGTHTLGRWSLSAVDSGALAASQPLKSAQSSIC